MKQKHHGHKVRVYPEQYRYLLRRSRRSGLSIPQVLREIVKSEQRQAVRIEMGAPSSTD